MYRMLNSRAGQTLKKENSNRKEHGIAFQIYLVNDVLIAHILTTHTFCPKTNGYRISEEK